MCDIHFAVDCKVIGTRRGLIANVKPSLHIPGKQIPIHRVL